MLDNLVVDGSNIFLTSPENAYRRIMIIMIYFLLFYAMLITHFCKGLRRYFLQKTAGVPTDDIMM